MDLAAAVEQQAHSLINLEVSQARAGKAAKAQTQLVNQEPFLTSTRL
jgi:hypothetical protein